MALNYGKQVNMVANPAAGLVFVEGDELCYNYKTDQWSLLSAYNGLGFFGMNAYNGTVGLVRFSGNAVDLQTQLNTYPSQTATITTGTTDLNQGGRTVVTGVRPIVNGGTTTVRVGVQDFLSDSVTWVTGTALHSRTGYSHVRAEGRYVRQEVTITGGFTTALGIDIDFAPSGNV